MKESDPLIVMTHTLIENSAPRPQLYQQVRPAKGFALSRPHSGCCHCSVLFCMVLYGFCRCSSFSVLSPHDIWRLASNTYSSIAFDCSNEKSYHCGHDLRQRTVRCLLPCHSVWKWELDTVDVTKPHQAEGRSPLTVIHLGWCSSLTTDSKCVIFHSSSECFSSR